jgi:hypothetical protein
MAGTTRVCKCGCGTPVRGNANWARGHAARGEGGYAGQGPGRVVPLPGPDDPAWDEPGDTIDVGELDPEPGQAAPAGPGPDPSPPSSVPGGDRGAGSPDPPPAHGTREWRRAARDTGIGTRPRAARVTQAVRQDVNAKISIMLGVPGSVWAARDPLCGGEFMANLPNIASAFASFVCESPDLLAWFAGSGGKFMLVLDIAAALMPVGSAVMAHHVYHTVEIGEPQPEPAGGYAA